ncbi:uncharacterized protein Tco025E_00534 [Trypanosoma conorhini]|uniref:Mitochondrial import inner membrane translocase subunit TIM50 n=1 Tax=Trypanosoma conorhini TaxID=83891 RepID=A0A422QB95_9TRYP|nr:uncharacterized protein Tco025E_00534 [Trypanosoma conorhini]RNF27227.1 hypothetical protein Tco025E_00534 [Trypanosoma conorhini]
MTTGRARRARPAASPNGGRAAGQRRGARRRSAVRGPHNRQRLRSSARVRASVAATELCLAACLATTDGIRDGEEQASSVLSEVDVINDVIQEFLLESEEDDDEVEEFNHMAIFHAAKPFLNCSRRRKDGRVGETRKVFSVPPSRPAASGTLFEPGLTLAEAMLPNHGGVRCRRWRSKALLPCDRGLPLAPLCIVVDLDETLVQARGECVHPRPYVKEFLDVCHTEGCEVVVWSAGVPSHVNTVVRAVAKASQRTDWFHHVISRHDKWYRGEGDGAKDLSSLGRAVNRVLMIDNSPRSIQLHPQHSVLVEDYNQPASQDNTLRVVSDLVRRLVAALRGVEMTSSVSIPSLLAEDAALVDLLLRFSGPSNGEITVRGRGLRYSPQTEFARRSYGGEHPLLPRRSGA